VLNHHFFGAVAALTALACGAESPTKSESSQAPGYKQLYAQYFAGKGGCAVESCHSGPKGISMLSFADRDASYKQLVGVKATNASATKDGLLRVTAGKPDASLLWWKLTKAPADLSAKHYGATMPIGGERAPGHKTVAAIKAWIEGGAKMDGGTFTADLVDHAEAEALWVKCSATDEPGLRKCLPAEKDPKKFRRLYSPPIAVPAKTEITVCSYLDATAEADLLIKAARGQQMLGGHHIAVFVAMSKVADRKPRLCSNADMANLRFIAGAGGQGGQDTAMPAGVALKATKGLQFVIQSHYLNTSDKERIVMDGVDLELTTAQDSPTVADPFALIHSDFKVPQGNDTFTVEKTCTLDRDMAIYLMLGHTHENGVLFTLEHLPGAVAANAELMYSATDGKLLRNSPEIKQWSDKPLQWKKGDQLRMRCTWQQAHDNALEWPEEMCVALMYYAPGVGFLTCDTNDKHPKVQGSGTAAGCAPKDHAGNELGVGKACTKGGGECTDNKEATFCLAEFEASQNYCSKIGCTADNEATYCGKDARCVVDPKGSACQPLVCK
jgi:hypothetical protein